MARGRAHRPTAQRLRAALAILTVFPPRAEQRSAAAVGLGEASALGRATPRCEAGASPSMTPSSPDAWHDASWPPGLSHTATAARQKLATMRSVSIALAVQPNRNPCRGAELGDRAGRALSGPRHAAPIRRHWFHSGKSVHERLGHQASRVSEGLHGVGKFACPGRYQVSAMEKESVPPPEVGVGSDEQGEVEESEWDSLYYVVGRTLMDRSFRRAVIGDAAGGLASEGLRLPSEDVETLLTWAKWYDNLPSNAAIVAGQALVDDEDFGRMLLADGPAALESHDWADEVAQLDLITAAVRPYFTILPDVFLAAGRGVLNDPWGESLLDNPDRTLADAGYSISKAKEREALLDVVRKQQREDPPDAWVAAGRASLIDDWADELIKDPINTLKAGGYKLRGEELLAVRQAAKVSRKPSRDNWIALGRLILDPEFDAKVREDSIPQRAFLREGYSLRPAEIEELISLTPGLLASLSDEKNFLKDSREYPQELFRKTIDSASKTYRAISRMSATMFTVGILLFIASAIYGALEQTAVAWLFGGLGVATFVSFFLIDPIDRSQKALTNLVQVQMGYINFTEQLSVLQEFRWSGAGMRSRDPERFEIVSEMLEDRTEGAMALLQRFITGEQVSETREKRRTAGTGDRSSSTSGKQRTHESDNFRARMLERGSGVGDGAKRGQAAIGNSDPATGDEV